MTITPQLSVNTPKLGDLFCVPTSGGMAMFQVYGRNDVLASRAVNTPARKLFSELHIGHTLWHDNFDMGKIRRLAPRTKVSPGRWLIDPAMMNHSLATC